MFSLPDFKAVCPTLWPPLPPGNIPSTHFYYSAARRITPTKKSSGTIGNRTRDLLACSVVPEPTASPRSLLSCIICSTLNCSHSHIRYLTTNSTNTVFSMNPYLTENTRPGNFNCHGNHYVTRSLIL
jgi:hypothetical protein